MERMDQGNPVWIFQGRFGRATVNVIERALVEHTHRELNMLFKLGGVDAIFRLGDENVVLDDTSVLLFNTWVPHAKLASEGKPTMILSLFIEPNWLSEVAPHSAPYIDHLFPTPRVEVTDEIRVHVNRLATAITTQMRGDEALCEALVINLVDALINVYARADVERDIIGSARPIDYRIRKALAFIHEKAADNPKMDDVARNVGLSRSRFYEQFKRCLGMSPQHYTDYVRMSIATRWLSTSDRPLIEIADELGFAGHSNFTRFFTQHIGVSPSEFRRQTASTDV